jgi:hypothetical protein
MGARTAASGVEASEGRRAHAARRSRGGGVHRVQHRDSQHEIHDIAGGERPP